MARPVTLFTGQWADLSFATIAEKAKSFGYDGLELACWGDHFEVDKALESDAYIRSRQDGLAEHDLQYFSISNHLVGQCVAEAFIDERHRAILPDRLWGDGDADGVRERCAEEMKNTARAAKAFGVDVVNGFTGSPVWHLIYRFPPTTDEMIDAGYQEFADRWIPILDVFAEEGVKFALEAHPSEIAYDIYTAEKTLEALDQHPAFGFNFDPSHFIHQLFDPAKFIDRFADRIFPRACQGFQSDAGQCQQHFGIALELWRPAARLGFCLLRTRRPRYRFDDPRPEPSGISGSALGRMGRQWHGPRVWRD